MDKIESALKKLNLTIPPVAKPGGAYVPAVRSGNLVFCSGQGPSKDGKLAFVGRVGSDLSLEQGYEAAKICALNCLAAVQSVIGSLDTIKRVVQVRGFVNCDPNFHDQPKVVNGASELLIALFGDAGRHARCALGTNNLPNNIPVEVEMVVEIKA